MKKKKKEILLRVKPMGNDGGPKWSQVPSLEELEVERFQVNLQIAEAFACASDDGSVPDFLKSSALCLELLRQVATEPMLFRSGIEFSEYTAVCSTQDGEILTTQPHETAAEAFSAILYHLATQSVLT